MPREEAEQLRNPSFRLKSLVKETFLDSVTQTTLGNQSPLTKPPEPLSPRTPSLHLAWTVARMDLPSAHPCAPWLALHRARACPRPPFQNLDVRVHSLRRCSPHTHSVPVPEAAGQGCKTRCAWSCGGGRLGSVIAQEGAEGNGDTEEALSQRQSFDLCLQG